MRYCDVIQEGDVVLAINGRLAGGLPFRVLLELLRVAPRPTAVVFLAVPLPPALLAKAAGAAAGGGGGGGGGAAAQAAAAEAARAAAQVAAAVDGGFRSFAKVRGGGAASSPGGNRFGGRGAPLGASGGGSWTAEDVGELTAQRQRAETRQARQAAALEKVHSTAQEHSTA
jgi:hypothetical protein